MTRKLKYLAIGGIAVLALSSVAWAITADQVGTRIRNKINSKWQTSNLRVTVVPFSQAKTNSGQFKQIKITANSVKVKNIKLAPVTITANEVTMNLDALVRRNEIETRGAKSTSFSTRVTQADLNKALALKKGPVQNLRCELGSNKITFFGTYKMGLAANLRIEGKLVPSADRRGINLVPTKASVGGVPMPAGPLNSVLSKMNPLVDFKKLPLSPRVQKIMINSNAMTVTG
jgi:uncharacterized protein YpmS